MRRGTPRLYRNTHTGYKAWWNDTGNKRSFHPHHHVYTSRIKWENQRIERIKRQQWANKRICLLVFSYFLLHLRRERIRYSPSSLNPPLAYNYILSQSKTYLPPSFSPRRNFLDKSGLSWWIYAPITRWSSQWRHFVPSMPWRRNDGSCRKSHPRLFRQPPSTSSSSG